MKKAAFSLPEILITLVIIGVVTAMLLPTLTRNFNEQVNSYREANIANKITQAMENMNAAGDLYYYKTTEEFAEALSKHLKIVSICDNNHLTDCWSSNVVRMTNGQDFDVTKAKTGENLNTGYTTNNVGLVLADGAQIILSYNPDVESSAGENITVTKKTLPIGFGRSKEFAYTTSITDGIDFVMDVNGSAAPNAEKGKDGTYNDIRSFRTASFSQGGCQGFKYGGQCIYVLGTNYAPISCEGDKNPEYCSDLYKKITFNYYAGARKACADLDMKITDTGAIAACTEHPSEYPLGNYFHGASNQKTLSANCSLGALAFTRPEDQKFNAICIEK